MAEPIRTDAERALSELFEARSAHFTEAPLDAKRAGAFERFAAAGLPHRRVEAYKYTDLKARLRTLPPAADPASDAELATLDGLATLADGAHRIVIANGRLAENYSRVPDGVRVASILSADAETDGVGSLVAQSDDALTLANIGLFDGGAILRVDGEISAPIEIVHLSAGDHLVMGRIALFVPAGGKVDVVERFIGASGVSNSLVEMTLGAGATVSWTRVCDGEAGGTMLSTHHIALDDGARLEHATISTGKGLVRNQVFCHIRGDEAEANFRAATVAIGDRHVDNTLTVRHDALHSNSSEVFRSAVGDHGVSIVQGRILVDPGAQKTDARMMSNALFLDDTGEVVNKPELEIFADDVQCGHGATSGDLDEDPVFYLRARGIPERIARRLLVEAFLVEALDRIEDETLSARLEDHLRHALDDAGAVASDHSGAA